MNWILSKLVRAWHGFYWSLTLKTKSYFFSDLVYKSATRKQSAHCKIWTSWRFKIIRIFISKFKYVNQIIKNVDIIGGNFWNFFSLSDFVENVLDKIQHISTLLVMEAWTNDYWWWWWWGAEPVFWTLKLSLNGYSSVNFFSSNFLQCALFPSRIGLGHKK